MTPMDTFNDDDHEDESTLPHTSRATSTAAAEFMTETAIGIRLKILKLFVHLEPAGATADAIQGQLGLKHQTNSARVVELADDNLIYDTGEQRATRSGHAAIVWRPTELGINAIVSGWYSGQRLSKVRRESYVSILRGALGEALNGWRARTQSPDELQRIAVLEELAKPSTRRRGP